MKNLRCLLFVTLLLLFHSCLSIEADLAMHDSSLEVEAYGIVRDGYVKMYDNQYHIIISEQKAVELGYSSAAYNLLKDRLWIGNEMLKHQIKQWEEDTTIISYTIHDCSHLEEISETSIPIVKTRSEQEAPLPSGILSHNGSCPVETRQYFPHRAQGVSAHCKCNAAPLGVNLVTTITMGTAHSASCIFSGTVYVGIAASGTNVTVQYNTTDSNGGICSWSAY